jgi:hypothetical protein
MASRAEARVYIVGDTKGFHVAMRRATWEAMTFAAKMRTIGGQMQTTGRMMTRSITLPIIAGLALATKAAVDEEKEMALLSKALRNNAKATDVQVAAVERWITKTQNATGVADGELRPALASLVSATKDTTKAQDLLGTALDISAAKGKPIKAVAEAMMKAYNGNIGALGRLGVKTKDATGKTLTFEEAMREASKTFGGAAAEAADTTAGRMAILKAKLADVAEAIGNVVIPILERLIPYVERVVKWFDGMDDSQRKLIVTIAAVVAAIGPMLVVVGKLLALFSAGPWGLAISAVAALIPVFVGLYAKSETFRAICKRVWSILVTIGKVTWTVLKATVETVIEVVKTAIEVAKKVYKWLGDIGKMTLGGIITALNSVVDAIGWIVDKAVAAYNAVKDLLTLGRGAGSNPNRGGGGGGKGYHPGGGQNPSAGATGDPIRFNPNVGASPAAAPSVTIPIYLDGREIAAYTVNLMSGQARRLARGMA